MTPMLDATCPDCDSVIHSDDLFEGECVTGECGYEFSDEELTEFWDGW